jgi:hypothetical protein
MAAMEELYRFYAPANRQLYRLLERMGVPDGSFQRCEGGGKGVEGRGGGGGGGAANWGPPPAPAKQQKTPT